MADNLDDGEFWLPSQFLTDDDILNDFKPDGPTSGSDLDSFSTGSVTGSTEPESDEDDLLGLSRQLTNCAVHSKGFVLSSSPQSTLCGCIGKEGSSHGSPNGPVSPPVTVAKNNGGATWDLLHKAADEVARIKTKRENTVTTINGSVGTGFFDCSVNNNNNKGLLCPPKNSATNPNNKKKQLNNNNNNSNNYPSSYYSPPQFHPLPPHIQIQQQLMKTSNGQQFINNRLARPNPLGLPTSAWPPLQAQNQPIPVVPPMFVAQPGPKRESVGTGVFLPRRVNNTPSESRKKSEGNPTKTRTGKGSQKKTSRPPTTTTTTTTTSAANECEIQLPQEWTY